MTAEIGIWAVGNDQPVRVERSKVPLEADLEDWTESQPSLLAEGLKVVARQLRVEAGFIDLLCVDAKDRWVIVELKRNRLYREALAQAIDYASCIQAIDAEDLRASIESGLARLSKPEGVSASIDYLIKSEDEDRDLSIIVAGVGVDPGMERVVNYLSQFQIPIRVVSFDVFQGPDGSRLLVREVLDDEASPTPDRKDKKSRTIEEIGKVAESEGVGEAYQQIIAAATGSGLFCRPYKHSVMITPPSHKSRFLMLLNPRPGQGLRTFHGADAFAEFIPDLSADEVEDALGPSDESTFITRSEWEDRTRIIVEFLSQLPDVSQAADSPRADAAAVFPIAELVHPGEWTTYGDLSTAVTGRSSAAMAIGNMARVMPDFPNPHRILNLRGQVPSAWQSADGEGPEACRQLLKSEGVGFDADGTASAQSRLALEELLARTTNR